MKVWIVCEYEGWVSDDMYYEPHPTGEVFTDEAKAKAYIDEVTQNSKQSLTLILMEGELK